LETKLIKHWFICASAPQKNSGALEWADVAAPETGALRGGRAWMAVNLRSNTEDAWQPYSGALEWADVAAPETGALRGF
jgi:uncharacterized membrane-anchored protein